MTTNNLKLKNSVGAKYEQHPFHIVDPTPLPLFMASAIVLVLSHIAFRAHPEYPTHEQGIFITKLLENWDNAASTLALAGTFFFLLAF